MKTKTLAVVGILLTVVALGAASAEKAIDRPSGIGADQWYLISDRLGLVIPDYQPGVNRLIDKAPVFVPPPGANTLPAPVAPKAMPPASAAPALRGYLMVKYSGRWTQLSVESPPIFPPGTGGVSP